MKESYPRYVLGLLLASYMLNSLDRAVLAILLDPIGREFSLSDTQLGVLTGIAFAAVYSMLGVPVAALADRTSHRNVLAASILLWSVATITCGLAGGFAGLLLARIGTGAGQAGAAPSSHSIISDYFPLHRRATAIAVFSIGAPMGLVLAGVWGGYGESVLGWRMTIALAGLPGLLLAPLVWLTIREKPRSSVPTDAGAATQSFAASAKHLLQRKSLRHLFLACAVHSAVIHATSAFQVVFMNRSYGWDTSSAGRMVALLGVASAVGAFVGGVVADRLSQRMRDVRWLLWVCAIGTAAAVPFQVVAFLASDKLLAFTALPIACMFGMVFLGPSFAVGQSLALPGSRAVMSSLMLFGMTLLGLGLGPLLVGSISDVLMPAAQQHSVRYAFLFTPLLNIWAAVHFFLAARTLREDMA